jgi:[ribosomal protein S5]-alanine N-acetyltransferase
MTRIRADIIIQTKRLRLRAFAPTDAAAISRLAGDYDVSKMCGGIPHPYPELAADGWIMLQAHAWARDLSYSFAVTLEAGDLIGSCGVYRMSGTRNWWEIGYWFGRPFWGRGYASEAAQAVMDWAKRELGADRMVAGHFADNPASGQVLRKLGFEYTHTLPFFGMARGQKSPSDRYVWHAGATEHRA